jgi:hypothetical protein
LFYSGPAIQLVEAPSNLDIEETSKNSGKAELDEARDLMDGNRRHGH